MFLLYIIVFKIIHKIKYFIQVKNNVIEVFVPTMHRYTKSI